MPMDKYKSFYEIVKMLCKLDLTKLRAIEKEIKILGKIKSKLKRKKPRSAKQKANDKRLARGLKPIKQNVKRRR